MSRDVSVPKLSGMRLRASGMATRPIGMLIQKIHRHARPPATAPPTTGPAISASPVRPLKVPSALLRSCGGKAALNSAMDSVLEKQTGQLAIQRRFVTDMRDIWGMQPRFEKRVGRMPFRLLESPRFRAGYDFLQLRCQSGELPEELAAWWQDFQNAESHEREDLIDAVRSARGQGGGDDFHDLIGPRTAFVF